MDDEPMDDNNSEQAPAAAIEEPAATPARRWAAAAGPWLDRVLLNMRVWLPALRTPDMKGRQVKYRARESRKAMTWSIGLPRQCWQCAATDGLTSRKFSDEIRSFESPTNILGGAWGVAAVFLFWWIFIGGGWSLKLAFLIAAGGLIALWVKSWKERVRVTVWSCAEHLDELTPPEAVSFDEDLYLYAPSEQLAEAARAELIAARKNEGKHPSDASPRRAPPPPRVPTQVNEPAAPAPSPPVVVRDELPPLKLAGDDEDNL